MIIDAIAVRGVLAVANDARDHRNNMSFGGGVEAVRSHRMPCYATRDIYDGEEILVEYGAEYWKAHPSG